jgi:(1->4)-alpha-D-glucan 1-alpha-D-glucosylmutase
MSERATYRLQFRDGMDFARAKTLAPYLAKLGISHLYMSPILRALPGSTHGYDGASYDEIEPKLGGEDGFRDMANAFRAEGLGLIADFVPNHMGASPFNPWWRDVLEWGADSPHASYFDIDWTASKLLIPVLAEPYGRALDKGSFGLHFDTEDGGLSLSVNDMKLPLSPPTYANVLARVGDDFEDLTNRFAIATPETAQELKAELAARVREAGQIDTLSAALRDMAADHEAMHALHEAQVWRLAYWRAARETLTYRRFFEVADLVGVRMEQPSVFEETHRLMLALAEGGVIDGLRLDHVDGLADPLAYFRKLREATGEERPFIVLVEKILEGSESLRSDWPVQGTTGYEFIRALGSVMTYPEGEAPLTAAYDSFAGETADYETLVTATKRHIFIRNLAGELDVLTGLAHQMAQAELATRDYGRDTLRRAVIELGASLPVYRTYVDVDGPRPEDEALIARAETAAKSTREVEDDGAIDFIARIWRLDLPDPAARAEALTFVTRLQQTTGPLMAKAVEDTLFYRYNRLIALNEVGGSPDEFGAAPARFHGDMAARRLHQPFGLVPTSTHDTKRGEDARARLYVLSERPEAWSACVAKWSVMNEALLVKTDDDRAPSANDEWMFYQALAGAWPFAFDTTDHGALAVLADRMAAFMLKAIKEAKVRTSWTGPDEPYEEAVEAFVRGALDPARSRAFLEDFSAAQGPLEVAGALNSLSQTLLKLTAPGVPDIYQGGELWDLSLVDPDNRRPVDFDARRQLLDGHASRDAADLVADWRSGAIKLSIVAKALHLRAEQPSLFTTGDYTPLIVNGARGQNILAFLRSYATHAAIAIVPLRASALLKGSDRPLVPASAWGDTHLMLDADHAGRQWRNVLTGETVSTADGRVNIAEALKTFPVALLVAG